MHQRVERPRDEPVDKKEILFDIERRVQTFEVARAVVFNAVAQCEILRASRRADRVGLNEAHAIECASQRRGLEQASSDSKATQVVERDRHDQNLSRDRRRASAPGLVFL